MENIVDAMIKNGDLDQARNLLTELAGHPGRKEHIRRELNYLILEGEYAIAKRQLGKAYSYMQEAKKVLQNSTEKRDEVLWKRIFDIELRYYILKNDQTAIAHSILKEKNFADSIALIHQRNAVLTRNSFYQKSLENKDLRLKNTELELASNKVQLKQEAFAHQNKILIITTIGLSLVIILLIVIWLIRKRAVIMKEKSALALAEKNETDLKLKESILEKEALKESLEYKERDITSLSNYLLSSSIQISDLRQILKRINSISDPNEKEEILLDFIVRTKNKIQHIQDQEKILRHIDTVNEAFFDKLRKKHPDLTKSELMLCGLIKAGMSNDQIALEKNSTLNSIKTSKTRIKKKLKISRETKLDTYLNKL